jgi:hypothetical protein
MKKNRTIDVGVNVKGFKKFGLLIGGLFGTVIQNKHEEKERKRTEDRRWVFKCPFCNLKFEKSAEKDKHFKEVHSDQDPKTFWKPH